MTLEDIINMVQDHGAVLSEAPLWNHFHYALQPAKQDQKRQACQTGFLGMPFFASTWQPPMNE